MQQRVPDWARAVLAEPDGRRAIDWQQRVADDAELVMLSGQGSEALLAQSERFAVQPATEQVLRPSQHEFRRLLRRFLAELPEGSVVADIACGEMEFVAYYGHLRYLPMDLSVTRLRAAVQRRLAPFAVVADVRRPPLLLAALDALVSTNTLEHLPGEQAIVAALALIESVRPGGRVALTLYARDLGPFVTAFGSIGRITGRRMIHGCFSRSRWLGRLGTRLGTAVAGGTLSSTLNLVTRSLGRLEGALGRASRPEGVWLTVERC